jgi:hypothetical protein
VPDSQPVAHVPLTEAPEGAAAITPVGVAADIPQEFCGHWQNHVSYLDIDCSGVVKTLSDIDGLPSSINATGHDKAWIACDDVPLHSLQPCGGPNGFGYVTSYWIEPSPTTPGQLIEHIVATNAEMGKPQSEWVENVRTETHILTMTDGPILRTDGEQGLPYCTATSDPAIASLWCGA